MNLPAGPGAGTRGPWSAVRGRVWTRKL